MPIQELEQRKEPQSADLKSEIFYTIEEYFGIDWKKYGNPLDIRFYISNWKEF